MPTCGRCGLHNQSVEQIKACHLGTSGKVAKTKSLPRKPVKPVPKTTSTAKKHEPRKRGKKPRRGAPRFDDFKQPPPGALTADEAREKYPSGATQEPRDDKDSKREMKPGRGRRGGSNFARYGMVNPPPSGGVSRNDY